MMACVKDVVAYVIQPRNILQIRVRGIAGEEALPAANMSLDDEAGIVKLTRIGLCGALPGSKYPELGAVGVPVCLVPRVLPKWGVKIGAVVLEVVPQLRELVPLFYCDARVTIPPVVGAVD